MFQVGGVSFKLSYLLLLFWLMFFLLGKMNKELNSMRIDFFYVTLPITLVIICMILGEIWLSAFYYVENHSNAIRAIITVFFASISFSVGRHSSNFKISWLVIIFFLSVLLNIIFIFFSSELPMWFINFYIPERATSDTVGFQTVDDILNLVRPRGIFGNPNASMLMINMLALFIHISIKNKLIIINSYFVSLSLILFPLILAAVFASRGEFVVSFFLSVLNFKLLRKNFTYSNRYKVLLSIITGFLIVIGILKQNNIDINTLGEFNRLYKTFEVFDDNADDNSSIARPLIMLSVFVGRSVHSPFFGTGISEAKAEFFEDGTQYFHNDWLYVLATSGLIGFISYIIVFGFFKKHFGWLVLIPVFLPGLINTFFLNIPAFICYFCITGILINLKLKH